MLKAVVEDEQLRIEFLDGNSRGRDAVGVLQVRNVGAELFEDERFVIDSAFRRAVAAAEKTDADAVLAKRSRNVCGERRLAGAADGDVAETDDGDRGPYDFFPAAVEGNVSRASAKTVKH